MMADPEETVRIASVQLRAEPSCSGNAFYDRLTFYVDAAADYKADFVVFPELFTLLLLGAQPKLSSNQVTKALAAHTPEFITRLRDLSVAAHVNIIAGSHLTTNDAGTVHNVCHVFLRDGSSHRVDKLHPTSTERTAWNVMGGGEATIIETDCGPIGIMICYDSEFPEQARHLVDQGARILFVPYCTDTVHGHLRVRYCCQARAVENQCYVVTSGLTGNIENIPEMAGNFARSAILTPCDIPFERDGIAAEATENAGMMIVADLDLNKIAAARAGGSVTNLADRRTDLYRVSWRGKSTK